MAEVSLNGGRTNKGIVKVNDTVRRPANDNSEFVARLLTHLENSNFDGAPKYLGIDSCGRESFSYLPGNVPDDLAFWPNEVLQAAAHLIRQFHDALSGSEVAGDQETVCHNDLSPCNTVFVEGLPNALIDFDAAAPGDRLWDLAYAAWLWLDLGNNKITAKEQANRLSLFIAAYGVCDIATILRTVLERQLYAEQLFLKQNWHTAAQWAEKSRLWVTYNWQQLENANSK